MPDIVFRANLEAKSLPLLSELQGRTVIVKGQDQNYIPQAVVKEQADKNIGIAQVFYAHNVLPTTYGYQSVGYESIVSAVSAVTTFTSVHILRDDSGNRAHMGVTSDGRLFILNPSTSAWVEKTAPAGIAGKMVTTAYVSGTTYIYFATKGCYVYTFSSGLFTSTTLTGLTASAILGIVGSKGYLVAYSIDTVAWSATTNPELFTPSSLTGAGSGSPEGTQGTIVVAVEVYGGFLLFTTANCVAATYSGNPRYPFNFESVTGAGGLNSEQYVSYDVNSGSVYAYTTSGLQQIGLRTATTIFAEVTDFLSGAKFEDLDETTRTLSTSIVSYIPLKRLHVIASRYLVISYGTATVLTHALVYDLVLQQFGKLKAEHIDCFEFQLYSQNTYETPKKSFAIMKNTGQIYIVNSDVGYSSSSGVIILGRFQFVRSRLLILEGVELENAGEGSIECYTLPSMDGKTLSTPVAGYDDTPSGAADTLKVYRFHDTALNHSIYVKGSFNLTTLLLTFLVGGSR